MKNVILCLLLASCCLSVFAIPKKKVLFLGNSYTTANDLPMMLRNVAASTLDSIEYETYAPGGYTLQQHLGDATTLNKIMKGDWDFVVLQEQSQRPAFPDFMVQNDTYPYAKTLDSLIRIHNICAETVFYMTWGYKNGDAGNCPSFPLLCTYHGMDSLIRARYLTMTANNYAIVSPVGAVRRYIRTNYPSIELYDPDGSHPTLAGTYAAACTFYAILLRKDPQYIVFDGYLSATVAANIRSAAKAVAYDSLIHWSVGPYIPNAAFQYTQNNNTYTFINQSSNATHFLWHFGDGDTSTKINPTHTYQTSGNYTVTLEASQGCKDIDTAMSNLSVVVTAIEEVEKLSVEVYPNPTLGDVFVRLAGRYITSIAITTIDGKLIPALFTLHNDGVKIDCTNYPKGLYFLRIQVDGREIIEKLVKE